MKNIFSIVIITVLSLGKITSQTSTPVNLDLSGTERGNKEYEALNNIQSEQVINSEIITTYTAGNSIVLKPGFRTKAGSVFTAKIENVSNRITIMTTNLHRRKYTAQAENILFINPDVVAVQEIGWPGNNFSKMTKKTGYHGVYFATGIIPNPIPLLPSIEVCGIGMLWKPELGTPLITGGRIPVSDGDYFRAYIVAEFTDYCVIATHYSTKENDRKKMTQAILANPVVNLCKNSNKPVYIAGDMNARSGEDGVKDLEDAGFVVLNNDEPKKIDLILEYNTNPNRSVINYGPAIPLPLITEDQWTDEEHGGISDHVPRYVRVKFK